MDTRLKGLIFATKKNKILFKDKNIFEQLNTFLNSKFYRI